MPKAVEMVVHTVKVKTGCAELQIAIVIRGEIVMLIFGNYLYTKLDISQALRSHVILF